LLTSITARTEPRRFHLSRSSIRSPAGVTAGHIRGTKGPPTIFIERRRVTELDSKVSDTSIPRRPTSASENASSKQFTKGDLESQLPSINNQPRPPAPLRSVRLPSGKVVPWNADSATLAAEMQAYTLQEIGHNLGKISTPEISTTSAPIIRARQVSSFKPKAPVLRYHERHPEQAKVTEGKKESNQDEIMTDAADPDGDDSGYVLDTYIRMPAEMFEFEDQKNVGLLILDSQPDIDEFYNDDSDSDSEIYDEEEDENGTYPNPFLSKCLHFQLKTIHQRIIPRMKWIQMMNMDAIYTNAIVPVMPPIMRNTMRMTLHLVMTKPSLHGHGDLGWPTMLTTRMMRAWRATTELPCPCQRQCMVHSSSIFRARYYRCRFVVSIIYTRKTKLETPTNTLHHYQQSRPTPTCF